MNMTKWKWAPWLCGPSGSPGLQMGLQVQNSVGHNPPSLPSLLGWTELGPDIQKSAYFWAAVYGLFFSLLRVPEPSLSMSVLPPSLQEIKLSVEI